jgi:hypothetical protein
MAYARALLLSGGSAAREEVLASCRDVQAAIEGVDNVAENLPLRHKLARVVRDLGDEKLACDELAAVAYQYEKIESGGAPVIRNEIENPVPFWAALTATS